MHQPKIAIQSHFTRLNRSKSHEKLLTKKHSIINRHKTCQNHRKILINVQDPTLKGLSAFVAVDGVNKVKHKGDLLNLLIDNQAKRASKSSLVREGN